MPSRRSRSKKLPWALGLAASNSLVVAGPCDIYAAGNTPCVAAHGTTRALYNAYNGPLYQVTRNSDGSTTDIYPLTAGGVANSAAQDTFCTQTTCVISIIYDQSGNSNDLSRAPPGGFNGPQSDGSDDLASAIGAPVTLNGQKAYGVFVSPGTGYRIDDTTNIATGNQAEGIYAVLDGTHYNDACCFDYGNAEVSNHDTGNSHMEAIYFGNCTGWSVGAGNGPWLMSDMENGLFSGNDSRYNPRDKSQTVRFLTSFVKGDSTNQWAIRSANAQHDAVSTLWNGPRPDGYYPMQKEGSIILGIGGDNSNGAQGTFYEGCMTQGYPSDKTESLVQANIVAARYATTSLVSGPAMRVGQTITFHVTTPGYTNRYLAHSGTTVNTQVINSSNTTAVQNTAKWIVRRGLGFSGCYSFESVDTPGNYIRHDGFELYSEPSTGEKLFFEDATWCPQAGLNGQGNSIRAWEYPTRYFRHYANVGYVASEGGPQFFDATYSYNNDVSFIVSSGFSS